MKQRRTLYRCFSVIFSFFAIAVCFTGCDSLSYTVGGTVSGLSGTLILQNNNADDLTVSANGAFTFSTSVDDSSTYSVTVLAHPNNQICNISNGSGVVNGGEVNSIVVECRDYVAYVTTDNGLSISTDGGSNFTNKTTLNGLGGNLVQDVLVFDNTVYVSAVVGGLSISTDGGNNFTFKTTANGLGSNSVFGMAVSDNTLYASTNGGLSISTDGGNNFTNKTTANGLGSDRVRVVYLSNGILYATTSGGFSISTDGGNNFTNKTTANGLGSDSTFSLFINE